jgi:type I restriction enzyme S subunit
MSLAAYPAYDNYNESGVDWLGAIPSDWKLTRLGGLFSQRKTKVSDKDYEPLSVTKKGILQQLKTAAKTNDGDNRKLVRAGDFVINSRSDRKGSSGVSPLDGSVSLINIVMQPTDILPEFCNHILKSHAFVEEYYRMGHGIVADLWTTRFDEMRLIMIALPSPCEQRAIAAFLDNKCEKIDEAVRIKEAQIALLRERRQILIQEAVTRGLNPDAPMKDSGIDWIGQIPAHWEVKRLKHIGKAVIGLTYDPKDLCDEGEGTLVLRSSNLKGGRFAYGEKLNSYVKMKISDKLIIRQDDILICSRNGSRDLIGKCALAKKADCDATFGAFTTVFRSDLNRYVFQILNSEIFKMLAGSFLTSTINQLTTGNLNSISVPIPPLEERENITTNLEDVNARFDSAITLKQDQITALKEYKTSLINAAVTGKIKVI